jgi:hypothetical protein
MSLENFSRRWKQQSISEVKRSLLARQLAD